MRKKLSLIFSVLFLICFLTGTAKAEPNIPSAPKTNIYIQDNANIIDDTVENKIFSLGQEVDNQTTAQIAVVTVNSLDGYSIEEYATDLFRKWGIGNKDKNNGVLLLLNKENIQANKPGRVRIEVGYGLEGAINDAKAGRILDDFVLPGIQKGDLSSGVYQAYQVLAGEVAKEYGVTIQNTQDYNQYYDSNKVKTIKISPWKAMVIAFFVIGLLILDFILFGGNITSFILGMIFAGRWGGGGGFGGGGFGGGGFGGGSSGGGGASR